MTFDGTRFQWRGQKWDFVQVAVKIPVGRKNAPIDIDHVAYRPWGPESGDRRSIRFRQSCHPHQQV